VSRSALKVVLDLTVRHSPRRAFRPWVFTRAQAGRSRRSRPACLAVRLVARTIPVIIGPVTLSRISTVTFWSRTPAHWCVRSMPPSAGADQRRSKEEKVEDDRKPCSPNQRKRSRNVAAISRNGRIAPHEPGNGHRSGSSALHIPKSVHRGSQGIDPAEGGNRE